MELKESMFRGGAKARKSTMRQYYYNLRKYQKQVQGTRRKDSGPNQRDMPNYNNETYIYLSFKAI
jgi:hypothetical protein